MAGTNFPHGIRAQTVTVIAAPAAITAVAAPAGGTGANAGGWDTAANRDLAIVSLTAAIADVTALRTTVAAILVNNKAAGLVPDAGAGTIAAPDAITASNPPAGGSGATAGGYDTATNRNLLITRITAVIADNTTLRTKVADLLVDLKRVLLVPSSGGGTIAAPDAITALTPPAGGTGNQVGCYDGASNRDLAIASLAAAIADVTALRTTVASIRTALIASGLIA